MRLIDADAIKDLDWITERGMADCGEEFVYLSAIDQMPTIDAVPVWFIEDEIKMMNLNVQIAMSEGDNESAVKWITRVAALVAMVGRWKVSDEEE